MLSFVFQHFLSKIVKDMIRYFYKKYGKNGNHFDAFQNVTHDLFLVEKVIVMHVLAKYLSKVLAIENYSVYCALHFHCMLQIV